MYFYNKPAAGTTLQPNPVFINANAQPDMVLAGWLAGLPRGWRDAGDDAPACGNTCAPNIKVHPRAGRTA